MLRYLIPSIAWRHVPTLLGCAFTGAIIAGLYGIGHDQITYTISPEYYTKLKFPQFGLSESNAPPRWLAVRVGFLASWWVGFFAGWFLARRFVSNQPWLVARRQIALGFGIILGSGLLFGLSGFAYGLWRGPAADYSAWQPLLRELRITDDWAFMRVAYIHNASYLGGLVGFVLTFVMLKRVQSTE